MTPDAGIDALCFYTPKHYLHLKDLAEARQTDAAKYHHGLGQWQMAVPAPGEDVITMAANACLQLFKKIDPSQISMIMFATESSVDQSKAAGIYLHRLLNLPSHCRVMELKQACYSATAGLQLALSHVARYPKEKVLLIASDIPRYGLNTPGEASHGAGAVAMCISTEPRTLLIEPESGYHTEDHMDFWRPNYKDEAIVAGKLSCELYYRFLRTTWEAYQTQSQRKLTDHQHFCFHVPIPRLVEKAMDKLLAQNAIPQAAQQPYHASLQHTLTYSRRIGNCYTASLYLALIALLDHSDDLQHQRIGLYSYGSGSVAEYFSAMVQPGYQAQLFTADHHAMMANRQAIDVATYECYYQYPYPNHGQYFAVDKHATGHFRLAALDEHKRIYQAESSEA